MNLLIDYFSQISYYREYLKQTVARDMRKQYKRSALGYVWSMLNPLLMMAILAVVFSRMMRHNVDDYAVFLLCGMLPWGYFDGSIRASLHAIRGNSPIIEQIPIPKFVFPTASTLFNFVTFATSLVPLLVVTLAVGRQIPITVLALPIVLLPLFLFTMGISLIVAVSNVMFEDTQHLVSVGLRALYFLCPILYPPEMLPEWLIPWVSLNPMFHIIEFMRELFYAGTLPSLNLYIATLVGSLLTLLAGLWLFKKADQKLIYFM